MTQPTVPDRLVGPALLALRDCLCNLLNTPPWKPVSCGCCVRHSAGFPPMDACDSAWVRLVQMTASPGRSRSCPGLTTVRIQLGIYRCVEVSDGTTLPSCDTMTAEAIQFAEDAAAMRRAVTCCEAIADFEPFIVGWEPIGPSGGCAGGALTVELTMNMLGPNYS